MREAELKHGRIAMLAAVGIPLAEKVTYLDPPTTANLTRALTRTLTRTRTLTLMHSLTRCSTTRLWDPPSTISNKLTRFIAGTVLSPCPCLRPCSSSSPSQNLTNHD